MLAQSLALLKVDSGFECSGLLGPFYVEFAYSAHAHTGTLLVLRDTLSLSQTPRTCMLD